MTTNKLTNIAKAILDARTIKNKTARTINTHLGLTAEEFYNWDRTLNRLHEHCYEMNRADYKRDDEKFELHKDCAFEELKALLDLIGDVKGAPIRNSVERLGLVSGFAVKDKAVLVGKALEHKSVVNNLAKQVRDMENGNGVMLNGINKDVYKEKCAELEKARKDQKALEKEVGSRDVMPEMSTFNTFKIDVQDYFAKIINGQNMKSYEEVQKELEEEKAAKKAAKKAKKAAKKAELKAQAK